MSKSLKVKYENKELRDILKAFKEKVADIRIGVLGKNTNRDGEATNAEVGAYHEFGTSKLRRRSFLRQPLTTEYNKTLKKSGAFDKKTIEKIREEKTLFSFSKKLAVLGVETVLKAFDSGGFGKWEKTKGENNTGQTLVDTQQLRNSIVEEVKKR